MKFPFFLKCLRYLVEIGQVSIIYTRMSIVETTSLRPVTEKFSEPLFFNESTKDSEDDEEIKFDLTSISIELEREPIRKV